MRANEGSPIAEAASAPRPRRRRPVSFRVSPDDSAIISAIARRAVREGLVSREPLVVQELEMDLTAVHANDGELDLDSFITLPGLDFDHDVLGIQRHIDRRTGRLTRRFEPRCGRRK